MSAALAWAVAAGVCALALRWLLARSLSAWIDSPNHRSLHARPVPRIGGVAIHAAWPVGWGFAALATPSVRFDGIEAMRAAAAAAALGLVFAVSLRDDRRSLGALPRFAAQGAAALLLLAAVGVAPIARAAPIALPAALVVVLVAVACVWAMNLYNFMDGSDGLAGGMAVIGFGTYAVVAWPAVPALSAAAAAVSGAAAGFLVFNAPPARVFMGDAGSVPLGFLAAGLGLAGIAAGAWGWWLPPLAFLPFALDATATLARRAWRRERLWEAHRSHAYQRLILSGWSHRRTALVAWAAMAACAVACVALARRPAPTQWTGTAIAAVLLLVILESVEAAWRRGACRRASLPGPPGRDT